MICANPACGREFKPKEARLKCCSRDCGIAYKRTPEYRAKMAKRTRQSWREHSATRSAGIAKMTARKRTPEGRRQQAEENRRRWASSEYRARTGASISRALKRPEVKAQLSAAKKALWSDPIWRERVTGILSAAQSTPTARANHSAAMRRRIAEHGVNLTGLEAAWQKMEEIWSDPARHAEMIARILGSRQLTYASRSSAYIIKADDILDAAMAIILDEKGRARVA